RMAYPSEPSAGLHNLIEDDFIVCHDVEADSRAVPYLDTILRPAGIRAMLSHTLRYKGQPRLNITAMSKTTPHHWTNEESSWLRAAASQMLIGYERILLFEYVWRGKMEWETTFDALADGLFIFDGNGILRRVNEAGVLFERTSAEQMLGRKCCEVM